MALVRFQTAPLNTVLADFLNLPFTADAPAQPVVNIVETPGGFRLELAAPGFAKSDFQITVEKNLLRIVAGKEIAQSEEGVVFHRREFARGTFERVFRLPETIDTEKVEATATSGILSVNLVKKAELQPVNKTIAVN